MDGTAHDGGTEEVSGDGARGSDALDEMADEIGLEPIVPDEDGMYVVRGRVTAEVGAALLRALEAAGEALHPRERPEGDGSGGGSMEPPSSCRTEREVQRRWADAIGLMAERALAAGLEEEQGHGPHGGSTEPP